jgi:eukaryotic-like serine/threonine-protein kinase
LQEIVNRCLEKRAPDRFSSAHDLSLALHAFSASGESAASPAPSRNVPAGPGGSRRRIVVASAALAIAAGAGVLGWAVRTRAPQRSAPPRTEFLQLTSQPGVEWFPSLPPDGRWILYAGTGEGPRHVFLQGVGSQSPLDLTADSADDNDQPVFSPDGDRIAFRSSRDGGGLFVMSHTGEAVRRVTRAGFRPAWSPDGSRLAFATENVDLNPQNVQGHSELWIVEVDGGEPRRVHAGDAVLPSFSPNDRRMVSGEALGEPEPITAPAPSLAHPSISADGRRIAYSSALVTANIQRQRFDPSTWLPTGDPAWVTTGSRRWSSPDPSPDGESSCSTRTVRGSSRTSRRFHTWIRLRAASS